MPDPIFERYKEALRAGHVAALRGRPDDALLQYRSAAAIAPDRALPHVGMAEVLLRTGRLDEALAACTVALRLAPHDESVLELAGRVHETAGRGTDASIHLDRVVDLREKQGRTGDALAAATRAHAADPTNARRDRVAALTAVVEADRARLSNPAWAPDAADAAGPARIAGDEAAVASRPAGPPAAAASAPAAAAPVGDPGRAEGGRRDTGGRLATTVQATAPGEAAARGEVAAPEGSRAPDASTDTPAEPVGADSAAAAAAGEPVAASRAAAGVVADQPVKPAGASAGTAGAAPSEDGRPVETAPLSTATAVPVAEEEAGFPPADGSVANMPVASEIPELPHDAPFAEPVADPGTIFVSAEERAAAGDPAGAAALYVEAAAAYLEMGAVDTAVDACLRALSGAPAGTDVHLALARIDFATGHDARAADRLDLLGRLLSLEGDEAGFARVAAFRAAAGSARERDGSAPGASATHRPA
jgi:hypothetical protein